ncbi:MAG: Uma2 family endonuclease [Solirubrobacteraceae bacterium]
MPTVVLDPAPAGLRLLAERRRLLGQDRRDEMWEGVLHMVPGPSFRHATLAAQVTELLGPAARAAGLTVSADFNLGDCQEDFRVPDGGLHRPGAAEMWLATAALVLEVLSAGDETLAKLPFYAAHHVDEVLIVDSEQRAVQWLALCDGEYQPVQHSGLVDLGAEQLAQRIDWP